MPFQLELPDIGEGIVDAEVQQWFVSPGDEVEEDQPLVEVMTDKATVVIPSPRRGRILRLFWKVGDVAKVHAPLVEMEPREEVREEGREGAGRDEAHLEGRGDDHEAAREEPAAAGPRPEEATGPARRSASEAHEGADRRPARAARKALATPAVRAMARRLGVAIDAVPGTGPDGRVTKGDLAALRARGNGELPGASAAAIGAPSAEAAAPAPRRPPVPAAPPPAPSPARAAPAPQQEPGAEERIPLRGVRRRIAENMARSKRTAAHFTFVEQCDVTELVRVKDRIAAAAAAEGAKVTFLPFVLKAAVEALRGHPRLNATMDEERGELVLHRRYDLGVASATEEGLVVPVVRGVDRRSLLDLAREIERLAQASKAGRIRPDDLGRSTFTVTSLGALGGLFATPVLNHPEVAILGVHRIRPTPVVRDGQIVVRDVMHVSVTSDHRVVDGDEAAAFAYEVIRLLEDPSLLFMRLV